MSSIQRIIQLLFSDDVKLRRQINYWASTVLLYLSCEAVLWFEVSVGAASARWAAWLTAFAVAGIVLFYYLVRTSKQLGLSPSQLAVYQGNFAIVCTIAAYAIIGQIRGAMLTILLAVMVFCAFALQPKKSYMMSLFAIVLLGVTMLWMVNSDPVRFSPYQEAVHFVLAASMLAAVAYITGQLNQLRERLRIQKTELAEALTRIQMLATRDELTMLANRRYMNEVLANEERRHATLGLPICLALLDIDWFKQVNDTFGHAAGDEVLRLFALQAQSALRATDTLARWGGEEFLLLMPDTQLDAASSVIERLKTRIAELRLPSIEAELRISFSAGLIALGRDENVAEAIKRADHAMYAAKSRGRNCIVIA